MKQNSASMPYDLERVSNNADSHQLLSVVAAVHHQGVGQSLDDGAVGLAESLGGISTSGVRDVDRGSDLDVVAVKFPPLVWRTLSKLFFACCYRIFRFGIRVGSNCDRIGQSTYVKEMSRISTSS